MPQNSAANDGLKSSILFDVSHITAVLTGGGSGLGLMITQGLVANGARVYVAERREEALKTVVELYSSGPGEIIPIVADISRKEEVERIATEIASKERNGIQLLVNNAGIARDLETEFAGNGEPDARDAQAISAHFMRSDPAHWSEMFATNVTAIFYMSMAFLPLLAKGCDAIPGHAYTSSIINISSNSGFLKSSTRGHIGYSASKAGSSGPDQKSKLERAVSNVAGRPGCESDISATVLFLAGPGGAFYNHQILFPDGGETLIEPATI
ncbi:MAG: hypothetical protein M1813_009280 [Trichoglossum hirsutum]|nr:MAG: hypothetical protein M1813_009280 [Trichoglossum hirsutum]